MELRDVMSNDLASLSISLKSHFSSRRVKSNSFSISELSNNLSVVRAVEYYHSGVSKMEKEYCFMILLKGAIYCNGYLLSEGTLPPLLAVLTPYSLMDFSVLEGCRAFYLKVNKVYFDHHYELATEKPFTDVQNNGILSFKSMQYNDLLVKLIKESIKKPTRAGIDSPEIADNILKTLIKSIRPEVSKLNNLSYCKSLALRAHSYMLSKNSALTLDDLCAAMNARPRSLQEGFKQLYGMGPVEYHKLFRLQQVRKYIRKNGLSRIRLADLIGMYGFNHSSRFSAYYKKAFGITPTQERKI